MRRAGAAVGGAFCKSTGSCCTAAGPAQLASALPACPEAALPTAGRRKPQPLPARPPTPPAGLSMALLRAQLRIPILGVCLGFQALALAHGGAITHAPEPVHGRLSAIAHSGHPLFEGIPSGRRYAVVRYHSLLVDEASLPPCLEPLAWTCGGHHALQLGTDDDAAGSDSGSSGSSSSSSGSSGGGSPGHGERLLMALAHRSLPHYGVQFHPESVATEYGAALLRNFAALTWRFQGQPVPLLPPCLAGKLPGGCGAAGHQRLAPGG